MFKQIRISVLRHQTFEEYFARQFCFLLEWLAHTKSIYFENSKRLYLTWYTYSYTYLIIVCVDNFENKAIFVIDVLLNLLAMTIWCMYFKYVYNTEAISLNIQNSRIRKRNSSQMPPNTSQSLRVKFIDMIYTSHYITINYSYHISFLLAHID